MPFCRVQTVSYACGINAPLDELRRGLALLLGATRAMRRIERVRAVRCSPKGLNGNEVKTTRVAVEYQDRQLLVTLSSSKHDGDQRGHGKFRDM